MGEKGRGESDLCWKFLGGITGVPNASLLYMYVCVSVKREGKEDGQNFSKGLSYLTLTVKQDLY